MPTKKKTILFSIIGARPQFIKLAPLCKALEKYKRLVDHQIIHTGQHYDYNMSKIFFDELGIPAPNYHLSVGSGSHGAQTAHILEKTEEILLKKGPRIVIVFGDTNSTLAGALAAAKLNIPIAHIEAGLRSYKKSMPEEVNRIVTDHLSKILFCPTKNAVTNLIKEGFPKPINQGRIIPLSFKLKNQHSQPTVINCGDIMFDALRLCLDIAEQKSQVLTRLRITPKTYLLATVHRAENTDDKKRLKSIIEAFKKSDHQIIWPVHPRTKKSLSSASLPRNIKMIDPLSYYDMLVLQKNAKVVLTDSGGVQKEAFWLKVPCVTLRDETEWVETVSSGANILAGTVPSQITKAISKSFKNPRKTCPNYYGDGDTADRIINFLLNTL